MKRNNKMLFCIVAMILVVIQFYRPIRNERYNDDLSINFTSLYHVPKSVGNSLQISCYDCHSNNTYYPWYSNIQPIAWFIKNHIEEGKRELNFNEFGNYSKRKRESKLKSIVEQIKTNKMPLKSYALMHKSAVLNNTQKAEIVTCLEKLIIENSETE